jgi:predicted Zn finger-like uncharacterized protein
VKLSCPSCGAKYSIADEKVSDRLAKIRCRKCSATIIVDGKVNPPNVYTSSEAAPAPTPEENEPAGGGVSSGEYSVDFGDNDQRTLTSDDIVQAYRRGELTLDTFVWAEGFADWQPISNVPELASTLNAVAAPAPARAAARTGGGRGSATDLFGGIDTAGSEEDVMTSAPQPAGLPAAPMLAATGARNESSVLFSLSALTASAPAPMTAKSAPAISAAAASTVDSGDDSGLIDLKALTSAAAAQAPVSPLTLGTAPLGMAAPLGGMTAPAIQTDRPSARQGGGKTGIYIAAALVVVGALIAGAIVITGSREAPVAATAPVAAPSPAAPTPAETTKKEEPTAEPPATGTAVAEAPKETPSAAAAAPKPVAASKPASGGIAHAAVKSKPAAAAEKPAEKPAPKQEAAEAPAEKKPPKKKEKTCNCAAGDLMCAMKCAAT